MKYWRSQENIFGVHHDGMKYFCMKASTMGVSTSGLEVVYLSGLETKYDKFLRITEVDQTQCTASSK